jgi:hypothetical protein
MAAMLLAAILGIFGNGPLASAEARGPDGLSVRYERFSRVRRETRIVVSLPLSRRDAPTLRLPEAFLDAVELRGVSPPPREVRSVAGERLFAFGADVASTSTPLRVTFRLEFRSAGWLRGSVGFDEGAPVPFATLVHP